MKINNKFRKIKAMIFFLQPKIVLSLIFGKNKKRVKNGPCPGGGRSKCGKL